jgi:hypothetical protein
MHLINKLLLISVLYFSFSCDSKEINYVNKEATGLFSMEIPDYMYAVDLQNPDADFQFGHEMKEHYIMAFTESHQSLADAGVEMDLESYTDFAINSLTSTLGAAQVEKSTVIPSVINDLNVSSYKIRGVFENEELDVFYYLTIYRNQNAFYYMTTWTLGRNEEEYSPIMEKSIQSFKAL